MDSPQSTLQCQNPALTHDSNDPDCEVDTCRDRVCANCDAATRYQGAAWERERIVAWLYAHAKKTMPTGSKMDKQLARELRMLAAQTAGLASAIEKGVHND